MRFTYKTEEEIQLESLLPEGEYDFEVIDQFDHVGKESKKEMIKLIIRVSNIEGRSNLIIVYLNGGMLKILKHFCDATGLEDQFKSEELLAIHCKNKRGRCVVGIEKDKEGRYRPKNVIKDFLKPDGAQKSTVDLNDDVPF